MFYFTRSSKLEAGGSTNYLPVVLSDIGDLSTIALEPFVSGIGFPTNIAHAGDERIFIATKVGRILLVDGDGNLLEEPFLDITELVDDLGPEAGLLGLAFHPDYVKNGYFYIYYTDLNSNIALARYSVDATEPNLADADSEVILLSIARPTIIHMAGALAFGPLDGYLYVAVGDGGIAFNAQDKSVLLGKILRLDVDAAFPYAIPPDNPFIADPAIPDEIWASGLRNPWRMTFDRVSGDLYIGDVGQDAWEEIDFQPAASGGGDNYGWSCLEGFALFDVLQCTPGEQYTFPIHTIAHEGWYCAIIGGYVYRGDHYPVMRDHYFFTDACSGEFWTLRKSAPSNWEVQTVSNGAGFWPSTFGEGVDGELYVGGYSASMAIYHIVPSH